MRNRISITLEFRVAPSKRQVTASTIRRRETQLAQKELLVQGVNEGGGLCFCLKGYFQQTNVGILGKGLEMSTLFTTVKFNG